MDPGAPQGSGEILPEPVGPLDTAHPKPPVMETGEAGPPSKMTSTSKLPKGADGSMTPVQGFAGAPGSTYLHAQALRNIEYKFLLANMISSSFVIKNWFSFSPIHAFKSMGLVSFLRFPYLFWKLLLELNSE